MNFFSLFSALQQFEILPILSISLMRVDLSITNQVIILFLFLFFFSGLFLSLLKSSTMTFYLVPTRWQSIFEFIYLSIVSMLVDNVDGLRSNSFFPLIFSIFMFVVGLNLIGLIPYSFTVTSHFIVTLSLSLTIFLGLNIICIRIHGLGFLSLFFPPQTSIYLALLLVPVELISYISKPISLAVRLFCNMMAGHILLKVFVGFAWSLSSFTGLIFILHYVPLVVLLPLFGLEAGVAVIQAFVFSLLICIYLNDALNLH